MTVARRSRRLPGTLAAALRVMPTVLRVKRLLASEPDLGAILDLLDGTPRAQQRAPDDLRQLVRGVGGALFLVGPRRDACVPRSLALFSLLTERGYPASFVSGIARQGNQLSGHAWVTIDGKVVPGSGDDEARNRYTENFRYNNDMQRSRGKLDPPENGGR